MKIKTRFAPSPTGFLHLGSIRTALINYLYAKSQGGDFYLRIEDTDQTRLVQGATEEIQSVLTSFGMSTDCLRIQSENLESYKYWANKLVETGWAYIKDGAVFAVSDQVNKNIIHDDILKGQITLPAQEDDFVIIKADGYPTYHFASVVDDHSMGITHVFRGAEWLTSLPKHLLLYDYLKFDSKPKFGHLSLILDSDGKKLSKRHPGSDLGEYLDQGFLPSALINYCLLLGNSNRSKEIFGLKDELKDFDITKFSSNNPMLDRDKLVYLNFQHIKKLDKDSFLDLSSIFYGGSLPDKLKEFLTEERHRVKVLSDIKRFSDYTKSFVLAPRPCDHDILSIVRDYYTSEYPASIKKAVQHCNKTTHYCITVIYKSVRRALCNEEDGPDLDNICDLLGQPEVVKRLTL